MMFKTGYQKGYPNLASKKTVSFTKTITKNIFGKEIKFYSSNPTILEYEDGYLINLRWINYSFHEDGTKKESPNPIVNLNSRYKVDKHFNQVSEEQFLKQDFRVPGKVVYGIEDIRIFKNDQSDEYYYTATSHDLDIGIMFTSSGIYNMDHPTYELSVQRIQPSFYDKVRHEKNWAFFTYKNKMAVVYEWYPLQLTEIDYETKKLNRLTTKLMPDFFKEARGSSTGYTKDKEIWFVLHKRRSFFKNKIFYLEYHHCFAIFDLDMNLLRYSEWFTLGNRSVEFCIGLIIDDQEIILSYGILDTRSYVSVYNMKGLRQLKWYLSQ